MAASSKNDTTPPATTALLLTGQGEQPIAPGSVVVSCATPGFRRGGIAHERLTIWPRSKLTDAQLDAMRREPELVVIEVR